MGIDKGVCWKLSGQSDVSRRICRDILAKREKFSFMGEVKFDGAAVWEGKQITRWEKS